VIVLGFHQSTRAVDGLGLTDGESDGETEGLSDVDNESDGEIEGLILSDTD
jgi:hypothetical protein